MREITHCEVCNNTHLVNALDLGKHPLQDDLVPIGDDRVCETYPVKVLFCATCNTAHQQYQLPRKQLFRDQYAYRSRQTKDVLDGVAQLANKYEQYYGSVQGKTIVDVGCNDGALLDVFKQRGAWTYGFEPTGAAKEASNAGHTVRQVFFDKSAAAEFVRDFGKPDIITFTNVFAHIEDLRGLIEALKIIKKPSTRIVIENHYLGSVLKNHQFDTFFHEHLRTYSYTSFCYIAEALGMAIVHVSFPSRYGGNIRVFLQTGFTTNEAPIKETEKDFCFELGLMNSYVKRWKATKRSDINLLTEFWPAISPIGAVALPARAPMLMTLLGLDHHHISAVYQIPGSAKIGHYVPGTRIPIVSDADYPAIEENATLLNMAWHIGPEIEARWRGMGFKGKFLPVIAESDFAVV
jgi:Methyltransferase domain/C-methyltransferase C-terminal domain/Putative zinc binding domain